ncbi:formate dehydrogenase subunit alpha, partial [bacterium]
VAGLDLFAQHPDRALVERALESVEFLVVQDVRRTETTDYASVVLPMTAPAETDGTYTNVSGIVQPLAQILRPLGQAKPVWRTMTELMLRLKPARPFIQARDVYEDLAARNPNFA